jgi:AcrR family transcriptional regulator
MMVQIAEQTRRPRGRPPIRSDEETRHLVIEAAGQQFETNGYAGTCMNTIAERAGVSTKTVYRLFPNKTDLLAQVVTDRIGQFILEIDADALDVLPVGEALERILIAYGELVLSHRTIAIHRLVIGEGGQFPEIASAFYELAIRRANDGIATWLRRQCERGLIKLDDPQTAAGMLRGMMALDPQRAVMLAQRTAPDHEEIAVRARQCAQLFLRGCMVRSRRPTSVNAPSRQIR